MAVEEFIYAHRATGPLKLRVFRPTGPARLAIAVLHLHGGAWRVGTPAMLDSRSAAFAARGYTVVQVQYRLLGHAPWPAPVTDVRSALRWVTGHAGDLGVRPDSLVLWGHSAGGHIALTTAATLADSTLDHPDDDPSAPVSVAALIDCYAPVSFRAEDASLLQIGPAGIDLAAILSNQRSDGALPAVDLLEAACTQAQADAISPLALVGAAGGRASPPRRGLRTGGFRRMQPRIRRRTQLRRGCRRARRCLFAASAAGTDARCGNAAVLDVSLKG
jgi:pimeloyl-ACP methyl ester carboxylesterase